VKLITANYFEVSLINALNEVLATYLVEFDEGKINNQYTISTIKLIATSTETTKAITLQSSLLPKVAASTVATNNKAASIIGIFVNAVTLDKYNLYDND
jgi:hypothetical protein